MRLNFPLHQRYFEENQQIKPVAVENIIDLVAGNQSNRFVGAFHARQKVEAINARLSWLRDPPGRRTNVRRTGLEQEVLNRKLEDLRKETVHLSKNFSFISSETAFIALPEELLKKYGFTRQEYEAQQVYDLEGMQTGGLPEPEEWLLMILGITIVSWLIKTRQEKIAAQ